MSNIKYISTLFVDIYVNSRSNMVYAIDFDENEYICAFFSNNQPNADKPSDKIVKYMDKPSSLDAIIVALEATSTLHLLRY